MTAFFASSFFLFQPHIIYTRYDIHTDKTFNKRGPKTLENNAHFAETKKSALNSRGTHRGVDFVPGERYTRSFSPSDAISVFRRQHLLQIGNFTGFRCRYTYIHMTYYRYFFCTTRVSLRRAPGLQQATITLVHACLQAHTHKSHPAMIAFFFVPPGCPGGAIYLQDRSTRYAQE